MYTRLEGMFIEKVRDALECGIGGMRGYNQFH
jgi:hypothetical protein